jgi:hypothetical protein
MEKAIPTIGILAGVAVVAAAAAGGTIYFMRPQALTPAAAPSPAPVAAPAPAPASPAAPAPAAPPPASDANAQPEAGVVSAPDVATVEFSSLVQPFSLTRDSAAYVAASGDAPQMYALRAGTGLTSTEKSKDGKWVIALTQDGQAAYLPAADLGPYDPTKAPLPEQPATVSGAATVIDTATLEVGDQKVPLAGLTNGQGGKDASDLQKLIDAQGPQVNCTLQGNAYLCTLPTGLDIGRTVIFNGAADASDDASDDYKQQVGAAKLGRRGIWK